MWGFLSGIFGGLFGTIGKTITDVHTSNTARQKSENEAGAATAGEYTKAYVSAGAQRAQVQQAQGTWGPFGLASFIIALTFAAHVGMIVADSIPWHMSVGVWWYSALGLDFPILYPEWVAHKVGSWGVEKLPGKFEETEHEILKALFYVGPPSAAVAVLARAFRR